MGRTQMVGLILASLLASSSPAAAAAPAWDHPGYDAEDSYYNPGESAINAGTVTDLAKRWSVQLRKTPGACGGPSAPLVAGGRVIATDQLGLTAYQATTGRAAWHFDWDDPIDSSTPTLAVSGTTLIAADGDCQSMSDPNGRLVALDLTTGKVRWRIDSAVPVRSFVVDKGIILISGGSESDELVTVAYRATDGHVAWRKPGHSASSVSADGRVLLTKASTTSAVSISTGTVLWSKPLLGYAETASPAGDRFLVTNGNALSAVSATTGAVVWTAPTSAATLLATDGRRVYRAADRTVQALDARTGRPTWTRTLPAPARPGQPVRAGGLLYAGGPVLSAASGAVLAPTFPGSQVVTGGRLLVVNGTTLTSYAP